jgi:hypothetical protein
MKSFDGHIEYVNWVLMFSSCESNKYDFLEDAVNSGGTGCDKSKILPPGAHFFVLRGLKLFENKASNMI